MLKRSECKTHFNDHLLAMCRMVLATTVIFSAVTANAQLSFGVKAGPNVTHLTEKQVEDEFSPAVGYHVGAFVSLPLSDLFFLNVEALYSIKGARYPSTTNDGKSRYSLHYLNTPVLLNYRIKDFALGIGPEFGYLTQAFAITSDFKRDVSHTWNNRFDLGAAVDISGKVNKLIHAGVRYTRGFRGIQKDLYAHPFAKETSDLYKNTALQLYVGFRLLPNEY
jgi:hypothetical protein